MGLKMSLNQAAPIEPAKSTDEQLLTLASSLSKNCSGEDIDNVLRQIARADLHPIARDRIVGTIRKRTDVSVGVLKDQLKTFALELGAVPSPDKALALMRRVLANSFENGNHLTRCPEGGESPGGEDMMFYELERFHYGRRYPASARWFPATAMPSSIAPSICRRVGLTIRPV